MSANQCPVCGAHVDVVDRHVAWHLELLVLILGDNFDAETPGVLMTLTAFSNRGWKLPAPLDAAFAAVSPDRA